MRTDQELWDDYWKDDPMFVGHKPNERELKMFKGTFWYPMARFSDACRDLAKALAESNKPKEIK